MLFATISFTGGSFPTGMDFLFVVGAFIMASGFVGMCFFILASVIASATGINASRRVGRSRFVAALNVVALTSGAFPIWTGAGVVGLAAVAQARSAVAPTVWLVCNALVVFLYWRAVRRRMEFVQYANR